MQGLCKVTRSETRWGGEGTAEYPGILFPLSQGRSRTSKVLLSSRTLLNQAQKALSCPLVKGGPRPFWLPTHQKNGGFDNDKISTRTERRPGGLLAATENCVDYGAI